MSSFETRNFKTEFKNKDDEITHIQNEITKLIEKETRVETLKKGVTEAKSKNPSLSKSDIDKYKNTVEKMREYFMTIESQNIVERIQKIKDRDTSQLTLYKRIKDELFREFKNEMTPRIEDHFKRIDFYDILTKLEPKSGKLEVNYIDSAETRDEFTLPSHLDQQKKEIFFITKNSSNKGFQLENASGTVRIFLTGHIDTKKNELGPNATVVNVNPYTGKESQRRLAFITNIRFAE